MSMPNLWLGLSNAYLRRPGGLTGAGFRPRKSLDPEQLGSVDWSREVGNALEREAYEWESKTQRAVARRMEMYEWLLLAPSMRPYMKKNFSYGTSWAPTSWHG